MQQIPTTTPITSSPNGEYRFRCSTSPKRVRIPASSRTLEQGPGNAFFLWELHKLPPLPRELHMVLLAAHTSDVCVLCAVIIRTHIIVQAVSSLA